MLAYILGMLSIATLAAAQGASAFLPDGSTLTQGSNFTVTVQQPHFGGGVVAQRSLTIGLTFGGAGPELFSGSFDPESSPDGTQDFVLTAPDNIGTGSATLAIIQLGAAEEEDSPGEFEDFFNIITLDVELE